MASYHLSIKHISRSSGRSAVAAAAYRSRGKLYDEQQGLEFDYSRKKDLAHAEILLPENAPERLKNRQTLWNEVEASEKRKDARLAREVEVALPKELSLAEQIELVKEYTQNQFVDKGMIADICVHESEKNPHAHIMLTLRVVDMSVFGKKERSWNDKTNIYAWREEWAVIQNRKLLEAGHDIQVDYRSYEDRGINLKPQIKLGIASKFLPEGYLHLEDTKGLERIEEYQQICRENGELILSDPEKALMHVGHYDAVFKREDIMDFAFRHSADKEQFDKVLHALERSPELIRLGKNEKGESLFTTRTMMMNERSMLESARSMNITHTHSVEQRFIDQTEANYTMTPEQKNAFKGMLERGDIAVMIGRAGTGKSYTLGAVREAYEAQGYSVRGMALSGIAAEGLQNESGIRSTTIHRQMWDWENGRSQLGKDEILVLDEAGMVGTRQMHQVLGYAREAGAKVILVGDNEQLQSIEAGGAFRGIIQKTGYVELSDIRRQKTEWQKEATKSFSGKRDQAEKALEMYQDHGNVKEFSTREDAKEQLLKDWVEYPGRQARKTSLMLAYTNKDVADLNLKAREHRKVMGELRRTEYAFKTNRGDRDFCSGDKIIFLRNETSLGVRNGSLGTVEHIDRASVTVRLDKGDYVSFDAGMYQDFDHGYAATVHKTQGSTIDRTFVLGTRHFDKHTAYVAMSRHREDVTMYISREDFKSFDDMKQVMSREQPKALAVEYAMPRGIEVDARLVIAPERSDDEIQRDAEKRREEREKEIHQKYLEQYNRISEKLHLKAQEAYCKEMGTKGITVEFPKGKSVEGYYYGTKNIDGRKYAVIESNNDPAKRTRFMIPYDNRYDQIQRDRPIMYDGHTMSHFYQKGLGKSQNKEISLSQGREIEK